MDGDQWIRVHLNDYHPDDVTPEAEHEIFSSVQAQWDARDKLAEPERFLLEIPSVPTSTEEMIERDIVDTPLYRKDVYRHMVYLQMSQDHMNMEREKASVIKTGKRKQRTESPERTVGQNQSANPRRTIMLAPREAPQSQLEHTRTGHTKEDFIELRKIGRLAPSHPKSVGPNDYRFEDESRQDTISVEDDHVAFKSQLMSEMSAMFKSLVSEELGPLKSQLKSLQRTNQQRVSGDSTQRLVQEIDTPRGVHRSSTSSYHGNDDSRTEPSLDSASIDSDAESLQSDEFNEDETEGYGRSFVPVGNTLGHTPGNVPELGGDFYDPQGLNKRFRGAKPPDTPFMVPSGTTTSSGAMTLGQQPQHFQLVEQTDIDKVTVATWEKFEKLRDQMRDAQMRGGFANFNWYLSPAVRAAVDDAVRTTLYASRQEQYPKYCWTSWNAEFFLCNHWTIVQIHSSEGRGF